VPIACESKDADGIMAVGALSFYVDVASSGGWWLQVHRLYVASFKSNSIEPRRARLQKVLMLLITIIKI
jgi:hypothetical protein